MRSLYLVVFSHVVALGLSVCPAGWTRHGDTCYYIFENQLNRSAAAALCASHSAQLVTFQTESDWAYIASLLTTAQLDLAAWTGLTYSNGSWGWPNSSTYTELHHWFNPMLKPDWVPQPDLSYRQAKIYTQGSQTYLMTDLASTALHPLCERGVGSRDPCDTNEGWVMRLDQCFKPFPPATWYDAISTCSSLGGKVLSPNSAQDLQPGTDLANYSTAFWIGASYQEGGYYFAADHRPVMYLPWLQANSNYSNPNQTCMAAVGSHSSPGYFMTSCDQELTFVCNRPVGTCPLGWYLDGTSCYRLHIRPEERMTWFMAVEFCKARNAVMAQELLTTEANTLLYNVLLENDVHLAWLGISGSGWPYTDISGKKIFGSVYAFDTTNVAGAPSSCGVTDFDPRRTLLYMTAYCFIPRPFVCTLPLANNLLPVIAPNVSCGAGWELFENECYQLIMTPMTYDKAVDNCRSMGAHIVSVNDTVRQSFFSTPPFMLYGLQYYWIGVKYNLSSAHYVLEDTNQQAQFWNLDPEQLYNSSYAPCVYIGTGSSPAFMGSWFAELCQAEHNFVCQKPAQPGAPVPGVTTTLWSSQCGIGWTYDNMTNLCYFVSPYVHKPWREARADCLARQGDLLSIDGEAEQLAVEDLLKSDAYTSLEESLWIGAADLTRRYGWGWSDGRPFRYLHWAEDEPQYNSDDGDNCAYIPVTKMYEWETRSCGDQLGFICRKSASITTEKPPTPAPTTSCQPQPLISGDHSILFPQGFSASSYKDAQHRPENCRMIPSNNASWSPANDTVGEWLAVAFHSPVSIAEIQIRGESSSDKYVSKFKLQYQYDDRSPWYWFTNTDRSVKIFDGVTVPDGSAAVFLLGEIQAHAVKIWPVEWSYGIAVQIELNGCPKEDCVPDYALGGPYFVDDRNFRASSELHGFESWNARLKPGRIHRHLTAWMPNVTETKPWIEVDLGKKRIIQGLTVAGDATGNYVAGFNLLLSQSPGDEYVTYMQPYGSPYIFSGKIDTGQTLTFTLGSSVEARVVRLLVLYWAGQAALKFDVLVCTAGCTADPVISHLPSTQLSASDSQQQHTPSRSKLHTQTTGDLPDAWQPLIPTAVDSSYIQADLGSVMQVTSVATQGSASEGLWVTSYYLAFSTDGQNFRRYGGNVTFYTTANRVTEYNTSVVYLGNFDASTVVKNDLAQSVNARYVRLYPHSYHTAVAVRWEIYACSKHTASTPVGCYTDDPADSDLPYVPLRDPYASMWPEACLSYCYDMGYYYAGLQNGDLCSCGNLYGMYGQAGGCNISCSDPYTNFTCGGLNKNMIYSTGLGANAMVCPAGWRPFRDSCYSLYDQDTWSNARNTCQNMGAHLVDISDLAENDMVASIIGDASWRQFDSSSVGQNSWIGFSDDRSNLNFEWSSRAEVNFTNWGRHQPRSNPGLQQNRVIISPDGSWTTTFSDDLNACICETAKKPSIAAQAVTPDMGCLPEWRAGELKCYRFYRQKTTWSQAQALCRSQNSTLARADTVQENMALSALLSELDGRYWLDVRDGNATGLYSHTARQTDVSYTNWARLKPDSSGRCVSVGTGPQAGQWTNQACDTGNRFVCETPRTGYYPQVHGSPATQLPCPSNWQSHGTLCYQFNVVSSNALLTWHEAKENCDQQAAALASFHSDAGFDSVTASLNKTVGNFWTGLNNLDPSTGYQWADGSVMNFVRWGDGQPDVSDPLLVCGEVLADKLTMGLQFCSDKRNWICSVQQGKTVTNITKDNVPVPEKIGLCGPMGNAWSKYKDYCYYISDGDGDTDDALTWRQSQEWCQAHGAQLASVNSADENAFIYGMLNHGIPVEAAWIGLNELDRDRGYSWSDGSPVGEWRLNWDVGEPNDDSGFEACVEMLARNGRWADTHCSTRQGYVCKQPAPGVNITGPTPASRHTGNCPPSFSRLGYKCYRVMGVNGDLDRQTWTGAQASCNYMMSGSEVNYTVDLASITTQEENAFITTLLGQYRLPAWLGMKRLTSGQFVWEDNEDLGFEGWNKNQPNSAQGNASCVFMSASSGSAGKWDAGSCQDKYAYVCQGFVDPAFPPSEVAPSAVCNITSGFVQFSTSCYKVVNESMSWQDARAYCSSFRSYLATVVDGFDWAELYLLGHNYSDGLWIGLNDLESPGTYLWDSGYPVTFTRWAHHQPQDNSHEACVYINGTGLFNKAACSDPRAFICRYDAVPPQETPTKPGDYCSLSNFTQHGPTCFLLVQDTHLTYEEAGRDCQLRGAHLASIHNASLTFTLPHGRGAWIGLRESDSEGFSWEDSTVLDYTNWIQNMPNWVLSEPTWPGWEAIDDSCVVMFWDGKWGNVDCNNMYGHLCSLPAAVLDTHPTLPPINITQKTPTPPTSLTPVPYSQGSPPSPSLPSPTHTSPPSSSSQCRSCPAQNSSQSPSHPTPSPTSRPTPSSSRPTSSSTSLPTSSSTSLPTSSSTSLPTSSPTSLPTSSSTSLPTSSPTSLPTSTPTRPNSSKTSLSPAPERGSTGLSGGDTAGIVLGTIIAVILVVGIVFSMRHCGLRRSSFLRREASRVKNFENSLYAETRKDTLTKSEEIRGIQIVGLDSDPRTASVSYSVGRDFDVFYPVEHNPEQLDLEPDTSVEVNSTAYNSEGFDFSGYNPGEFQTMNYNPTEFNFAARNFEEFDDIDTPQD